MTRALGLLVAGLLCLASATAHANGRLPGATGLAIHPSDERQLLLGLSFGLALTRDGAASWSWMCEQQIEGNGGDVDPSIVVTSDGTLVVISLTNGGVLVSRDDGCSFERAMGPLEGNRGVDLTLDPSRPGHVLALMSKIVEVVDAGYPRFHNFVAHSLDHGRSWEVLAELPDDMLPETLEVAPSDANRLYVSGAGAANPLQGIIERSDDGGLSWKRTTVDLPRGTGSLFVSGIHPKDPDRLWLRVPGRGDVSGLLPSRLWRSMDGGATFGEVAASSTGMLGFAVSPDGDRIAFGGPMEGLFVAPTDASAAPLRVSDLRVHCLRWVSSGLYLCASEPADPFSLGYAADPMQGFVPLWRRADTCRATCAAPSRIEQTCHKAWQMIVPLVGAQASSCDGSSLPEASLDAGPDADKVGTDGGGATALDASPAKPEPTATRAPSTGGCTARFSADANTPWWLAPMLTFVHWRRRKRALHPQARSSPASTNPSRGHTVMGSLTEETAMEKVERGAATSPHVHVEADARHLDASLLQLDLTAELAQLEGSEPFRLHGHGAKTLVKQPDLRVVLMVMKNGVSLGTHETKGRLTIQVLKGRISLTVGEQRVPLARGSLFALAPKLEHDVAALEESAFLLTVAWPSTNL